MSRDELPSIAPPSEGEEAYRALGPVELQYHIGYKQYYGLTHDEFVRNVVPEIDETVEPHPGPWSENGDPQWDIRRFGGDLFYAVYNVLLVESVGGNGEGARRVGVGKVHFEAFHHAGAELQTVILR